jgi:hypothetical protein
VPAAGVVAVPTAVAVPAAGVVALAAEVPVAAVVAEPAPEVVLVVELEELEELELVLAVAATAADVGTVNGGAPETSGVAEPPPPQAVRPPLSARAARMATGSRDRWRTWG